MDKLDKNFDTRPWGSFEVIDIGPNYQVKRITVLPGKRLSLQSHKHRKEHWIVANGDAEVEIDGEIKNLKISQSIDIPLGSIHRLSNNTNSELIIIEIQFGEYLGEDDIIRYEDDYSRV
ncbi:MAG: mannose-6-phosphate isomerase [SAR116 cluster bacterium]|nr:mannose-6-phosphate isomerase [SAR116 cluster bacterium]